MKRLGKEAAEIDPLGQLIMGGFAEEREVSGTRGLSQVERSVNRSGDNCKACAANSDPAKVPVHPGCNCDIVTDSVELLSIEESQFVHADSAVRPNLSTVAILDDKNSRFSDVYRWFDSVAPLMTEQDTVSMTRATEEIWLMVQSLVDAEIMTGDADVVTRDLDSGATMLLMRPGAGLDGLRQLYREATEGGANA